MRAVEDSIQQHFPDLTSTNEALTDALSRLHAKMPAIQIPRIYYFNSGFNASILAGDSLLGIGLDRFLGEGNHYYALLGIPQYIQRSMGPEWIVSTTLLQYLEAEYPLSPTDATLLNTIIDQGKKYYIVQASTPGQPDTLTLPFTQAQLEWLSKYEKSVWEYLSEHKLLYSTNSRTLSQFTRSAPFTAALGQDSPGQAATYIGIQIVRRYMARNPSTAWAQLLSETTAQEILQGARYNPR